MENSLFENIIFSHLFELSSKENNLLTSKEIKLIQSVIEANPYFIEIIAPEIKIHNSSWSGEGGFDTPSNSKLFYTKTSFANEIEFSIAQLKFKHNPLYFSNSADCVIYSPFCFIREKDYNNKTYLLFNDIFVSNNIHTLKGCQIINLQIKSGNFDLNGLNNTIELFVIPNQNTLVALNIEYQIPRITQGVHLINDKLLDFKYSIDGCYLSYSALNELKSHSMGDNLKIHFGIYDIFNAKIILCKST